MTVNRKIALLERIRGYWSAEPILVFLVYMIFLGNHDPHCYVFTVPDTRTHVKMCFIPKPIPPLFGHPGSVGEPYSLMEPFRIWRPEAVLYC